MRTQQLMDYLSKVFNLEVSCYQQKQVLKHLESSMDDLLRSSKFVPREKEHIRYYGILSHWRTIVVLLVIASVVGYFIGRALGSIFLSELYCIAIVLTLCVEVFGIGDIDDKGGLFWLYVIAALVLAKITGIKLRYTFLGILYSVDFISIIVSLRNYLKDLKKMKNEKREYQALLERNKLRQNNCIANYNNLKNVYDNYKITYKKTVNILDNMYSCDIVYVKYRSLIPICTFYEYLESGRCDSLEGAHGAYNLYENEIRLDTIINKLDVVISKLDDIIDNQRKLYDEMVRVRDENSRICKKLDDLSYDLKKINDNSSIIEYNSRIAAQNTEVLKWMQIFDYTDKKVEY
jgi:hypothetical protein